MELVNFLSGAVKLILILIVVLFHNDFRMVARAQVTFHPLWQTANDSLQQPCTLSIKDLNQKMAILQGSQDATCSLQITAETIFFQNAAFKFFPSVHIPSVQNVAGHDYFLYVERIGILESCPTRIIQINDLSKVCEALFLHKQILLRLQGNVSLIIYEMQGSQLTDKERDACPEQGGSNCNLTTFSQQVLCSTNTEPNRCRLDLAFSSNCIKVLGFRQISAQCGVGIGAERQLYLVIYPIDRVWLDLAFNYFVSLTGSPFRGLRLQILDLSNNDFEKLEDGVFLGLDSLQSLYLQGNNLFSIEKHVFNTLYNLEVLLLFGNHLVTLDEDVFHDLYNLIRLDLDSNSLITLPEGLFRNLAHLKRLYLFENELTELSGSLFQLTLSFTRLDLQKNKLVALPDGIFSGMKSLLQLNLYNNMLVSLDEDLFRDLESLLGLYIHDNNFKSLPESLFHGLTNVIDLYLSSNRLNHLNGNYFNGHLKYLEVILLNNNNLTVLHSDLFHNLENLQILHMAENQLAVLNARQFEGLYSLLLLRLSFNHLETFHRNLFKDLINLKELKVSGNKLKSLPSDLFRNMINLQILLLSFNELTELQGGFFGALQALIYLDLIQNNVTVLPERIFSNQISLVDLYLDGNKLWKLEPDLFDGLEQLKTISLSSNEIQNITKEMFDNLRNIFQLDLSKNRLATLQGGTFHDMGNLYRLNLHKNHLETLDPMTFQGLINLNILNLDHNRLKLLPEGLFSGLDLLHSLYLSDNRLDVLPDNIFDDLNNLDFLKMDSNSLSELRSNYFRNLTSLRLLSLAYNQLLVLEQDVFKDMTNLRFVILANNRLKHIDSNVFLNARKLKGLELKNNRLSQVPELTGISQLIFLNLDKNPLHLVRSNSFDAARAGLLLLSSHHEICECYVSAEIECLASDKRSAYLTCERLLSDRALMVMMWLIGIGAVIGNLFVLVWRQKSEMKNKIQDWLLINLALSDLLMGVYMLMVASADLHYGDTFPMLSESWRHSVTCRIAGSLSITSSEASVFFVMLISIDRYICIRFPYSTRRLGKYSTITLVIITWVICLALGIAPSVMSGRVDFTFYDNSHVCIGLPLAFTNIYSVEQHATYFWTDSIYEFIPFEYFVTTYEGDANGLFFSTSIFFGVNCICYLVVVFCYIEIVRAVKASSKQVGRTRDLKQQLTLTIKVSVIVATDFLCWFPIIILGILVQTWVITLPPSVFAWLVTVVLPINSALNPYLYTIADIISGYKKKRLGAKQMQQPSSEGPKQKASVKTIDSALSKMTPAVEKVNSLPEKD